MQISRLFKGITGLSRQADTAKAISTEKENIYSGQVERWRNVVEIDPSDRNARLQLLDAYANANMWTDAASLTEELGAEFPKDYHVQVCIGRVFQKKGETVAEFNFWSGLNEMFPNAIDPMVGMAKIAALRNNMEEANVWADRALKADPSDTKAKLLRAKIYQQQGKTSEAILSYKDLLSTDSCHYEAEINLSSALLKEERFDELLERLPLSIERHPTQPALKMCLFRTYCRLQNYDSALETLQVLLDQDVSKHKVEYYLEKSDLLLKLGRNDEADIVCKNAIELYPKNIKLLTIYARVGQRMHNAA